MKNISKLVIGTFLLVLLVSPVGAKAQAATGEDLQRALLLQLIAALQQQIELLQAELDTRQANVLEPIKPSEASTHSVQVDVIAAYQIEDDSDIWRIRNNQHQDYFARVFELLPSDYDKKIGRLLVFEGDDVEFDAFVETNPPEHKMWTYAAHEELMRDEYSDTNTELIIHELGHIVSYEIIAGAKPSQDSCESYFDKHGCPASNSYLRAFTEEFWNQSDLEDAEDISEARDSYRAYQSYYEENEDEFVTDYAVLGPEEDFSESFMYFVLRKQTKGEIANQKIDFFADYPELLSTKEKILENR